MKAKKTLLFFVSILCVSILYSCAHFDKRSIEEAKKREAAKYKDKIVKLSIELRDLYTERDLYEKFLKEGGYTLTQDDWIILKTRYKYLHDTIEIFENLTRLLERATEATKQTALDTTLDYLIKTDTVTISRIPQKFLEKKEIGENKNIGKGLDYESTDLKSFSKNLDAIRERYNDRRYDDVVSVYENSLAPLKDEIIPNEIKLIYALSLIRTGNVNLGTEKLAKASEKENFDKLVLKIKLANLYYAMGDYEKAKMVYNQIIDDKIAYEDQIQNLREKLKVQYGDNKFGGVNEILASLTQAELIIEGKSNMDQAEKICNELINKYPNTPYAERAKELLNIVNNFRTEDIEVKIEKVRKYIENNQFQLAYEIIFNLYETYENNWPNRIYLETLKNLESELNAKKQTVGKTADENIYSMNLRIYEEASSVIETSKDEALLYNAVEKLKSLLTTEFKENAVKKINDAKEAIIKVRRNKAGGLFLKAQRLKDVKRKKALLTEAYNILKDTIEEFKDSTLKSTLEENLLKVIEEIKKIEQT